MRVKIGSMIFDSEARVLLSGGTEQPLSPKAFALLALLVERRPNAVSKSEIQERLWPKTFVSEGNLTVLMAEIRKALGDGGKAPRFIRTVHGFGYASVGTTEIRTPASTPRSAFRIAFEGSSLPLSEGENVLGRDAEAEVTVDRPNVSRRHAVIRVAGGRATLEDLASKNGTFRNGTRVEEAVDLMEGDEIGLGSFLVRFCGGAAASTKTECR